MIPTSAGRGRSSARATSHATAGTATSTENNPFSIRPGRSLTQRNSPGTTVSPTSNMMVNTVARAAADSNQSGTTPVTGIRRA